MVGSAGTGKTVFLRALAGLGQWVEWDCHYITTALGRHRIRDNKFAIACGLPPLFASTDVVITLKRVVSNKQVYVKALHSGDMWSERLNTMLWADSSNLPVLDSTTNRRLLPITFNYAECNDVAPELLDFTDEAKAIEQWAMEIGFDEAVAVIRSAMD
jgi:hypothetical protein